MQKERGGSSHIGSSRINPNGLSGGSGNRNGLRNGPPSSIDYHLPGASSDNSNNLGATINNKASNKGLFNGGRPIVNPHYNLQHQYQSAESQNGNKTVHLNSNNNK